MQGEGEGRERGDKGERKERDDEGEGRRRHAAPRPRRRGPPLALVHALVVVVVLVPRVPNAKQHILPAAQKGPDGCVVSSGFLLVETVPGRESHVLELLARVPGVTHRHVLFTACVAVKVEASRDAFDLTSAQLRSLEGVVGTRIYRAKNV